MEDGVVKVIAPTADTPADRAGIKAGDYITHIDGQLIFGMTLDEAVTQMRGRPGTTIEITVVREGQDKPMEMTITRSEEHTSELQSLMRISYAVFCLKKKRLITKHNNTCQHTIFKTQ